MKTENISSIIDSTQTDFDGTVQPVNPNNNRIHTLNEVFEILRLRIPTFPYERRLSKIDTLHLAISYIHLLQSIIQSNLTFNDYIIQLVYYRQSPEKPIWATSGIFQINFDDSQAFSLSCSI
jgi:hypothetical protein